MTAAGLLRPSVDTAGASDLIVSLPDNPFSGGLAIDNRGSRYSGIWSATADAAVNSVFDDGDQLDGSATLALDNKPDRRAAGQLRYRHPVGDDGAVLSFSGTITHGEPGSTLQAFDVLTDSWAVGPRITLPLKRTRAESIVLEGGLTIQDATVDILGAPLSHDRWRVADIGISYLRGSFLGGSWSGNLDVAQGLPILGASDNGAADLSRIGARMDFTKIDGGLRYVASLPASFSVAVSTQGQYAFDPLLVGEQFAFGGSGIGRGYDTGALTGDHGLGGALELRYDRHFNMAVLQALQPYVFFDAAKVWDVQSNAPAGRGIDSVGGGVRAWLDYNLFGGIELVQTLEAVPGSDGGRRATKALVNLAVRF